MSAQIELAPGEPLKLDGPITNDAVQLIILHIYTGLYGNDINGEPVNLDKLILMSPYIKLKDNPPTGKGFDESQILRWSLKIYVAIQLTQRKCISNQILAACI